MAPKEGSYSPRGRLVLYLLGGGNYFGHEMTRVYKSDFLVERTFPLASSFEQNKLKLCANMDQGLKDDAKGKRPAL